MRIRFGIAIFLASVNAAEAELANDNDRARERAALVAELASRRQILRSAPLPPSPESAPDEGAIPLVMRRIDGDSDEPIRNRKVLDAMESVPRHWFVPAELQRFAYEDRPLPIGNGQTISQPYVVAFMTQLLDPQPDCKILEVGTGSGYQAAVLTKFSPQVYTIEIVEPLYRQALVRLKRFGLDSEHVRLGDGYRGIPQAAPFDRIIVTAAADQIPRPLIEQLRPGGRMVIPVGPQRGMQRLVVLEKDATSKVHTRTSHPVKFVPLTGGGPRSSREKP